MSKTIAAIFDGQVFRPVAPVDLEPNTNCMITIVSESPPVSAPAGEKPGDAWDILERISGTVDAPKDWSAEHDHYLYGTPKRHGGSAG